MAFSSCADVKNFATEVLNELKQIDKNPGVNAKNKMHKYFNSVYNKLKNGIDTHCKEDYSVDEILEEIYNILPVKRNASLPVRERIQKIYNEEAKPNNFEGGRRRSTRKKAKRTRRTRRR